MEDRSPQPSEEPSVQDLNVDYEFFNEKVWPMLAQRVKAFEKLKVRLSYITALYLNSKSSKMYIIFNKLYTYDYIPHIEYFIVCVRLHFNLQNVIRLLHRLKVKRDNRKFIITDNLSVSSFPIF